MTTKRTIAPEAVAYMRQARGLVFQPGDPRLSLLAIPLYEKALAIEPDCAEIYLGLATAYHALGGDDEAWVCCRKAQDLAPGSLQVQLHTCMLQIPAFYAEQGEVFSRRQVYHAHLEGLLATVRQAEQAILAGSVGAVASVSPFYLIYQGYNDRRLQAMYGEIVGRIMAASSPPQVTVAAPPCAGEPIRVGIASSAFWAHSVWKVLLKGWLAQLDKERFQLFGYALDGKTDEETEAAHACCAKFVAGPKSLDSWRRIIGDDRLHVLIYPEIGVGGQTISLAGQRLAPVQCSVLGYPNTSGLPTVDYYLSGDLVEPDDADDHYTEQLIRLPNLSFHYQPLEIDPEPLPRTEFGLRSTAVVYFCAQALWKYLPQHDEVFARIAREVSDCQFVFLQHKRSVPLTKRFEDRVARAFTACGLDWREHIVLMPPLSDGAYHRLNQLADIFLDSIGYSGWTTTLESLNHDLPIVTMPGEFMRSRLGTAVLTWMGAPETIAGNLDEYVDIAVRLGVDAEWRRAVSQRIAVNKQIIYGDMECIRGLEHFLEQAVQLYFQA